MSRVRNTARSLVSGYAAITSNVMYTLASVPLALHYLSKKEFGLWLLVTQVANYLALIDAGVTASVSRILMDHKDHKEDGLYGSVMQTGALALAVQGACVGV